VIHTIHTNRVARFFLVQYPKTGKNYHKMYQMAITYNKCPHKIQTAIQYANIFHSKALKNIPKKGFLASNYTIWQPCIRTYICTFAFKHFQGIHREPLAQIVQAVTSSKHLGRHVGMSDWNYDSTVSHLGNLK
jgi:hypothetical protein